MPRPAKTLLEAFDRYPYGRREDRLTEVLACTFALLPELARSFVGLTGAPSSARNDRPRVITQGTVGGSGRPDMVIEYRDAHGKPRRVLSEHKIDAGLTGFQRLGYADWRRDAFVLVAPDAGAYRRSGVYDECITWLDVAKEIDRLGVATAGSAWRRLALDPDHPTRVWCLEELLQLLERQNVGVSNMAPMDESTVTAFGQLRATRAMFETFLTLVRDDARIKPFEPSPLIPEKQSTQWWISLDGVVWRYLAALDSESGAHVGLEPSADWLEDDDEPVLYAGFYFATPDGRLPEALTNSPVREALREAGARVGLRRSLKQGRCAATLYLSQIAAQGGTLREQAEYAAGWAADAIQRMSRISG